MEGAEEPKIKEVNCLAVISDLHLGEEESVLNTTWIPQESFDEINEKYYESKLVRKGKKCGLKEIHQKNLEKLYKKLKDQGAVDELIILGDFMDLCLASLLTALEDAEHFFLKLAEYAPNVKKIILIPGNHDHHLWFQVFDRYVLSDNFRYNVNLPGPAEYAKWLVDPGNIPLNVDFTKTFLSDLIPKEEDPESKGYKPKITLEVAYPHLWRKIKTKDGYVPYYFTHGHYLKDIFTNPVSSLFPANKLEELEVFNMLWFEAVWYHLGQAGSLSTFAKNIYEKRFDKDVEKELEKILDNLLNLKIPGAPVAWMLKALFWCKSKREFLREVFRSGLRGKKTVDIREHEVADYIKKYLHRFFPNHPRPFYFIFGHTHATTGKQDGTTEGLKVRIDGVDYPVENTGGWLLESKKDGNTGFLFIDANGPGWVPVDVT